MSTPRCLSGAAVAVVLLLALAGHAEAVPSERVDPKSPKKVIYDVNINSLIDDNLPAIRNVLSDLDPLDVKDIKMPLNKQIFLELTLGWLQNLSQLNRVGNCSLRYTTRVLTLDIVLGWNEIAIDYRYLLKLLLIKRRGDIHAQLSDLKVHIVVDLDLEAYEIRLRRWEFTNTKKITIKLEGHLTDFLYNILIKAVTSLFKDLILETIESEFLTVIQESIDEINLIIGKNHNRMLKLVNLIVPFDYENDINSLTLIPIQRFLLEKQQQ